MGKTSKEARVLSSIIVLNFGLKIVIDYVLTYKLMKNCGYFISLPTTTLIYLLMGFVSILLYDFYKTDCLNIEKYKESKYTGKQIKHKNRFIRLIMKWERKMNEFWLSVILTTIINPGIAVIYLRKGFGLYNGFSGKNVKKYFFLSIIISNIYWNTAVLTGFSLFKLLKMLFFIIKDSIS